MVFIGTAAHSGDMSRKPYKKHKKSGDRPEHFIREWREYRGLTQEQVAGRAEMSVTQISKIETGDRDYRQSTLKQFAVALNCEPADLLRPPVVPVNELAEIAMRLDAKARAKAVRVLREVLKDEEAA